MSNLVYELGDGFWNFDFLSVRSSGRGSNIRDDGSQKEGYHNSRGPCRCITVVEEKLAEMGCVKRIWGETRVETAVALAEEAYADKNKVKVIVITDYANPKVDAALLSYVLDAPLLYVKSDTLSLVVKEYILNHKETIFGPTKIVLMGVDPKVAAEINALIQ
ncbi:MAG: cell wall-binding repeat-containing protein [Candidatus Hydrothermarchaeales archaeon]